MSGTIVLGSAGGNITIEGGDNEIVLDTGAGGSGGGGSALTAYQSAVIYGYTGTEAEFYTELANPVTAQEGVEIDGNNLVSLDISTLPIAP